MANTSTSSRRWDHEGGNAPEPKRAYAWADLLELPRDAFFQFVTGEIPHLDVASVAPDELGALTAGERALLASYRRLTPAMKARLREHAETLEAVAAAPQRQR